MCQDDGGDVDDGYVPLFNLLDYTRNEFMFVDQGLTPMGIMIWLAILPRRRKGTKSLVLVVL